MNGRTYVEPDDVKALAEAALAHRVIVHPGARLRGITSTSVIRDILSTVPVPGGATVERGRFERR
jgi:MoxR-like ATPase